MIGVKTMTMSNEEELKLQDALTTSLFNLTGIQQALWHVREESSEYPMFQVLAESMSNNIKAIAEAMPEEWQKGLWPLS